MTAGGDLARALELFAPLGALTSRAMMGGHVIYCDGQLFATIHGDGALYLRSKGALARRLKAEGGRQLTWARPSDGKVTRMGYWSLPEAALDDPDLACDLARQALAEG